MFATFIERFPAAGQFTQITLNLGGKDHYSTAGLQDDWFRLSYSIIGCLIFFCQMILTVISLYMILANNCAT